MKRGAPATQRARGEAARRQQTAAGRAHPAVDPSNQSLPVRVLADGDPQVGTQVGDEAHSAAAGAALEEIRDLRRGAEHLGRRCVRCSGYTAMAPSAAAAATAAAPAAVGVGPARPDVPTLPPSLPPPTHHVCQHPREEHLRGGRWSDGGVSEQTRTMCPSSSSRHPRRGMRVRRLQRGEAGAPRQRLASLKLKVRGSPSWGCVTAEA